MSRITKAIVTFLRDHIDLIEDNDYDALYADTIYNNKTWGQVYVMCSDDILKIDPVDHRTWRSTEEV